MSTTPLDRRRDRATAAHTAAERAQATVTELDDRLRTNADLTRDQNRELRNAQAEVKRLKRALKTQERDRARLAKAHRKAADKAKKARAKVGKTERKYSKAVLAEMVQREKDRDRAGEPARPDPAPETEGGADIARDTAARATAAKAAQAEPTP